MKLERTVKRLASATQDGEDLRRTGRDVGHELNRERMSVLRRFRAELARLDDSMCGDFVRGYRAAMADIVAAFTAALEPEVDQQAARNFITHKRHASGALELLLDGPRTPTDLAEALPVSLSTVSRLLNELRHLGLVESSVSSSSPDGRAKPHQLTPFGQQVISEEGSDVSRSLASAMRATVDVFSLLATEHTVWHLELDELFASAAGASSRDFLGRELARAGLAYDIGDALLASEMSVPGMVASQLTDALKPEAEPPSFVLEICNQLNPQETTLLVRSSKTSAFWDQSFCKWASQVTSVCSSFARAETITRSDIEFKEMPHNYPGQIALLYESVPLLKRDEKHWSEFGVFKERARHKFCLVSSDGLVPDDWTAIYIHD